MSWFATGYEKVEQKAQELEEQNSKVFLPQYIVTEKDEQAYVTFLTPQPITYYHHWVPAKNRYYTCPNNGDASKPGCPLCSSGNKASFQGAYLVVDHRYEQFKRKNGEEVKQQHTLKIAKYGIRVLKALKKLDDSIKKGSPVMPAVDTGILGVPFSVMRSGSGTDTQYTFNPLAPNPGFFKKPDLNKIIADAKKESLQDLMVDSIAPLSQEKLLEVLGGFSAQSQPQQFGQPANFQPQQFGQPTPPPAPFGGATQPSPFASEGGAGTFQQPPAYNPTHVELVADDDDVIDFTS